MQEPQNAAHPVAALMPIREQPIMGSTAIIVGLDWLVRGTEHCLECSRHSDVRKLAAAIGRSVRCPVQDQ